MRLIIQGIKSRAGTRPSHSPRLLARGEKPRLSPSESSVSLTREMFSPKSLSSDKNFRKRLALFLMLLLCQQGTGSFIKVRPNTLREFQYLKCQGEFNKVQYMSLGRVCEDCHNLYRQPEILTECKSNCFQNSLFPTCVSLLMLDRHEDDLNKKVALISGQEL